MNNFCGYRLFPASVFVWFRLQNSPREIARVFQEEIEFLPRTVLLFLSHSFLIAIRSRDLHRLKKLVLEMATLFRVSSLILIYRLCAWPFLDI